MDAFVTDLWPTFARYKNKKRSKLKINPKTNPTSGIVRGGGGDGMKMNNAKFETLIFYPTSSFCQIGASMMEFMDSNIDKKYMELNGAALNVNKPRVTSRKTAFPEDK